MDAEHFSSDNRQSADWWFSRWQNVQLPALAATGQTLRSLLPRIENVRPPALADIVLRDALFALHALRGINSMPRGRYGASVLDMANVVLLLGPRRFVEEFAGMPAAETRLAGQTARYHSYLLLERRARLSALLAAEWGRLRLDVKVEELFLAGLLYPLRDWLILLDDDIQHGVQRGDAQVCATRDWLLSREALPIYARLLEQWKLPDHFIDLLLEDRQNSSRAQCVFLAAHLAVALEKGWWTDEVVDLLAQTAVLLKVEHEQLWPLLRQILLREARQHPVPQILPLAAMLPLLPPPPPTPPEAAPSAATPPKREVEAEPTLPDKGVLQLRTLAADTPFAKVLATAMQVLHRNFGLARLVVLTPQGRTLRPRQCTGDDSWNGFAIALDGQGLFARVMGKSQTLWMHGDNRERLQSLLSAEENRLLGHDPWFALSLCRGAQPLALLICARSRGGTALDSTLYMSFQRLAQEVIRRLG